jgi:DNA-binding transcriptional LysR family regulator
VELSVVTGLSRHLCQQVEARTLDVAVISLPHVLPHSEILARPTLQWVASSGFRLPEDGAWPFAFFPEGCAFTGAALHCLIEAGVPHRIALVSASEQGIQAAVAAELAAGPHSDCDTGARPVRRYAGGQGNRGGAVVR